ncbi:hypothetical protein MMPV_003419 [Pyropia vietnamensis]
MASSVETAKDLAELLRCPRPDVRVGAAAAAAAYSADARFCTELFRADEEAPKPPPPPPGHDASGAAPSPLGPPPSAPPPAAAGVAASLLRALLRLTGDTSAPATIRSALTALINLTAASPAAAAMLAPAAAADMCVTALLDTDPAVSALASLYAGLLANLTRTPAGVAAVLHVPLPTSSGAAFPTGAEPPTPPPTNADAALRAARVAVRVRALAGRVAASAAVGASPGGGGDAYESAAMALANLALLPAGRDLLLRGRGGDPVGAPLATALLPALDPQGGGTTGKTGAARRGGGPSVARRAAAAVALRNCALAPSAVEALLAVGGGGVVVTTLLRCLSPSGRSAAPSSVDGVESGAASSGDNDDDDAGVPGRPATAPAEADVDVRLALAEALLALTRTTPGRDACQAAGAAAVATASAAVERDGRVAATLRQVAARSAGDVDAPQPDEGGEVGEGDLGLVTVEEVD